MNIRNTIYILLALLSGFSACTKTKMYNTPHPDKSQIVPHIDTTAFTIPGDGMPDNDTVIVIIDKDTVIITDGKIPEIPLLEPGEHEIIVINKPDGVTIDDDGVASVDTTADGYIIPNPEILVTDYVKVTVEPDSKTDVNIKPEQRMRKLTVQLTVKEGNASRIKTISGTINNIAHSFNIKTGKEENPGTVKFDFIKSDKFSSSMFLFGIINIPQMLTLTVTFTDNTTAIITSDISELLKSFNTDKARPLTISNEISIGIEVGFTATITDWIIEKEDITIN